MSPVVLSALVFTAILHLLTAQVIQVVEIQRPGRPSIVPAQTFNLSGPGSSSVSSSDASPVFEYLRPKGVRITIPGPYPPSYQYRLKFHINLNKEFGGWNRGDWNEGVIIRSGRPWSYSFPQITVEQGDTLYYWIEAEGSDWIKGYKGKHQVTQPAPHGFESTDRWGNCGRMSVTTYSGGRKACAGEQLITSYTRVAQKYLRRGSTYFMQTVKQIGGLEPEETFTVFTNENVFWNSTHNAFVPSLLEDRYGPSFVNSANFTLEGCTSKHPDLCSSGAAVYLILPPILSGRHSTEQSFSFRYGIVEVTAKLPRGDWIVPELWLLPKERVYGNSSGRIVMAMSRGNKVLTDGIQDYSSRVLEAGVEVERGEQWFRKVQDKPWSNDYHKFKLIWTPDKMEFFVDGEEIGRIEPGEEKLNPNIDGSKIAPFDQEFYLVFGVHVGGDKDFPNSLIDKPWKNHEPKNKLKFWKARQDWQETWSTDSALIIKGLSVTALDK